MDIDKYTKATRDMYDDIKSSLIFGIPLPKRKILPVPTNPKPPINVFRIIDRETGDAVGSYSRSYGDELYDMYNTLTPKP